jgi:hypothetical protein
MDVPYFAVPYFARPLFCSSVAQTFHFGQNIKKFKDFTPDTWRYRIGAWRFFNEKVVSMLSSHSFSLPRHFSHFSPLFFLLFTIQGLTPIFC